MFDLHIVADMPLGQFDEYGYERRINFCLPRLSQLIECIWQ